MNIADYFKASGGWKRRVQAVLFGVCATAALPPVYILPLLIPSFTGLFLLVSHAPTRRQAFLDGWWWGLGYFVTGLYWMTISLYVEPEKFAWLTPFALFGVPSVLALYIGLVTCLLYGQRTTNDGQRIILFAALWVGAEYLRAHLFTGFPWNLTGYVWTVSDVTLQFASVVGIYGLSWLTVIAATMPALFFLRTRPWPANITCAVLLVLMVGFGLWRLDAHPIQYTHTKIRVVQANIQQSMKWDVNATLAGLRKYADLTRSPGLESAQIVVWPETAVPLLIRQDSQLTRDLGGLLPEKTLLITGGLRGEGDEKDLQAWNSLFAIDHLGHIVSQYDKHHLVPFGEFVPLRHVLPVENIAGGHGDFSRGPGPATLTSGQYIPYSPLICYEAIFPDEATDGTGRAQWLVNITNDAWFGVSSGPYQHLEMARMRAVEQGVPLVRAAGTGISVIFDPLGRELMRLPLEREGVLDSYLPKAEIDGAISSRYPYTSVLFMIALSALFLLLTHKLQDRAL